MRNSAALVMLLAISKNDARLYTPPGPDIQMARARFLCLYLLVLNQLWDIYRTMRERGWRDAILDPTGEGLLTRRLGPLQDLTSKYVRWLQTDIKKVKKPSHP